MDDKHAEKPPSQFLIDVDEHDQEHLNFMVQ
jgi:hypothetical protein